jgi:hypothetical protein
MVTEDEEEEDAPSPEVEEDDRVNLWGRRARDYVGGKLGHFNGKGEPWLVAEEEDMARFLASDPQEQAEQEGLTVWQLFNRLVSTFVQPEVVEAFIRRFLICP